MNAGRAVWNCLLDAHLDVQAALSGVAAITLACAVTLLSGSARADPPSGVTPQPTDIVAVGSQSVQALSDQLATAYDTTGPAFRVYSWDAVNPATGLPGGTITTKNDSNCAITRPDGGVAGLAQLQLGVLTHSGSPCADIATYDGVPPAGDASGLVGVTSGQDLVVYAYNTGWICSSVAISALEKFGFLPSTSCGTIITVP